MPPRACPFSLINVTAGGKSTGDGDPVASGSSGVTTLPYSAAHDIAFTVARTVGNLRLALLDTSIVATGTGGVV